MKNARGIQQEQVDFSKKTTPENRNSDTLTAACFWCRGEPVPVLVNNIVQRSENGATSVESLAILLVHAEEEHELGEEGGNNRILSVMILMKRRLL